MSSELVPDEIVDASCALLSHLKIVSNGNSVIPGRIIQYDGNDTYSVEFDLGSLGLKQDVEQKLIEMNEQTVLKIADQCDVSEEDDGMKDIEHVHRRQIFSLHHSA